ncbi:MAG: hypothetical protein ABJC19_04665 [Gemmatimonadota bacterium]
MTFASPKWFPLATILSVINMVAVGFAAREAEPMHAAAHAVLAVALGVWATRLRHRGQVDGQSERLDALDDFDALDSQVADLQQALAETQERLDFAERILAQREPVRRLDQEPPTP